MKVWPVGLLLFSGSCLAQDLQELKVGFGTHKPPYIFEREDRGLEYDIVVAAAHAAGFRVEASYSPTERQIRSFTRKELDAMSTTNAASGVAPYYSQTYVHYQNIAVALASHNYRIEHIRDLGQYTVRAFSRARLMLGDEYQQMADSNPLYHEEAQPAARNRLLYSGRADVVIGDRCILHYFNREVYTQVDTSQPVTEYPIFPAAGYQIGFHDAALRDRFDQGLAIIRANGKYAEIEGRYAGY